MEAPWIQIDRYQDQENQVGPGFSEYVWQAMFACQVGVRSHQEWVKLKWGFNASALFDETLERQRLFLESQYTIRNELKLEAPDHRTLAFRYINRPGEGLILTIIGKLHARTEEESVESVMAFYRELKSTFPYDYTLTAACSREEFLQISGLDILDQNEGSASLAQIKRAEIPVLTDRRSPFLQGFWQSSSRAHEQIWRSLAATLNPLLMNISMRATILYPRELGKLSNSTIATSEVSDLVDKRTIQAMKHWNELYTERRLTPWKKFFYLQIHLASTRKIDENLFRVAGTSLTLENNDYPTIGYQAIMPRSDTQMDWRKKLRNLDVVFSASQLPIPRLSEVADMDEVFAVVRLPYSPPEDGFPDVKFAVAKDF